jgi:hypothetical protein
LGNAQTFSACFGAGVVKTDAFDEAAITAFLLRRGNDRVKRAGFRATARESNDNHGDSFEGENFSSV